MFSSFLEQILTNSSPAFITEFVCWFIAVAFLLCAFFAKKGMNPILVSYAPTLLTSLGIFGTFVGIVIGLLNFNPSQIDSSIGGLLEGLKTAFITSLIGMAGSILFKGLHSTPLLRPKLDNSQLEGVGPEQILLVMENKNRVCD